jgi:hypothetical protein
MIVFLVYTYFGSGILSQDLSFKSMLCFGIMVLDVHSFTIP